MTLRIAAEGETVSKQGKFVSNHDVKSWGGGSELNVIMTLIFSVIVWTCPLAASTAGHGHTLNHADTTTGQPSYLLDINSEG